METTKKPTATDTRRALNIAIDRYLDAKSQEDGVEWASRALAILDAHPWAHDQCPTDVLFLMRAAASVASASHHVAALHDHERATRVMLRAGDRDGLMWRRSRIEGHAIRAVVAMLTSLVAS